MQSQKLRRSESLPGLSATLPEPDAIDEWRVIRPERIVIQSSVTIGGTIINKGEKLTVAGVVDEARVYGLYQGGRPQIFVRAEDALRPSPLPGSRTPQIAASLFP